MNLEPNAKQRNLGALTVSIENNVVDFFEYYVYFDIARKSEGSGTGVRHRLDFAGIKIEHRSYIRVINNAAVTLVNLVVLIANNSFVVVIFSAAAGSVGSQPVSKRGSVLTINNLGFCISLSFQLLKARNNELIRTVAIREEL